MIAYSVILPILPEYGTHVLHLTPASIGVIFSSYSVALMLFTPIFGLFADKIGRRSAMLVGSSGLLLSSLGFSVSTEFWQLVCARMAQGMSAAATWVVGYALCVCVCVCSCSCSCVSMCILCHICSFGIFFVCACAPVGVVICHGAGWP
jgi:MFS family permease